MVFVWSHLTDGDPAYTLVQVSVNDLIMLVAFVPIVQFLVTGASSLTVPFQVLLYSVIVFIVIPLAAGTLLRALLVRARGKEWFEKALLPRFAPVTISALLATLVFIFAFQADNITGRFSHVLLIAVPITLQVYFNASLAYGLMKLLKVEHAVAAPGALIGASNFFELAVATAIALVRSRVGRGSRDRRRRAGRGSGDALGLRGVQSDTALVYAGKWRDEAASADPVHGQFGAQPDGGRSAAARSGRPLRSPLGGHEAQPRASGSDRRDGGDRNRYLGASLEIGR